MFWNKNKKLQMNISLVHKLLEHTNITHFSIKKLPFGNGRHIFKIQNWCVPKNFAKYFIGILKIDFLSLDYYVKILDAETRQKCTS